jgi:chemosensory pili system protein ChpA (sensor histidine kinase/response regulator)
VDRQALEPADPELWRAFSEECAELLEGMDRVALGLEESKAPRDRLRDLLPQLHTLKGVVNTMGMSPTGRTLHRVEDFIEALMSAEKLPSMRAVASFLLGVHTEVRRSLDQAARGYVEASPGKLEARIAKLLGDTQKPTSSSLAERSASAGPDSEASEGSASNDGLNASTRAEGRRFVRVGTARLDNLMNLAGELVVSRSRLLARVDGLRTLQTELGRGSRRLLETVDKFCEEHEFTRVAEASPLALAAGAEELSAPRRAVALSGSQWRLRIRMRPPLRPPIRLGARSASSSSIDTKTCKSSREA